MKINAVFHSSRSRARGQYSVFIFALPTTPEDSIVMNNSKKTEESC